MKFVFRTIFISSTLLVFMFATVGFTVSEHLCQMEKAQQAEMACTMDGGSCCCSRMPATGTDGLKCCDEKKSHIISAIEVFTHKQPEKNKIFSFELPFTSSSVLIDEVIVLKEIALDDTSPPPIAISALAFLCTYRC